jgi:hypothetical protein
LASSTSKKVQIWRFDRDRLSGFVNPLTYLGASGVELLSLSGTVSTIPYAEIKRVHFVRDFEPSGKTGERSVFQTRPKLNGLWVRLLFKDGEVLEGVLPNNLLQLEPQGFTIVPPDYSYNNQRLFIPRCALSEVQVLGVVGSPLRRPRGKGKVSKDQIDLFGPA